jgi:hypothetical protein
MAGAAVGVVRAGAGVSSAGSYPGGAAQLRLFGAKVQGLENDAAIGATALAQEIPLITTVSDLASAVMKLGGVVRYLAP